MKALTFRGRETIRFESVPDPTLVASTDVIVKVQLAAICGSDLHVYHGRETGLDDGTIMGHEFTGEIAEVGPEVERFRTGDVVAAPFTTNCGTCFYCRHGLTSRCDKGQLFGWLEQGVGLHGAQAEYVRVPLADATLIGIPDGVHPEEAVLLSDVLPTGFFCADMAEVGPGITCAVIGCGPVGLMAIVAAKHLEARTVFGIDSVPERLALAQKLGATPINHRSENAVEIVREATQGRGADAVLEVVGSSAASRLAIDLVRPGGTISAVGVHTERHFPFSPAEAYDKNLTYRTGRCPARTYMARLLPILQQKKQDLLSIVTHRLPLRDGSAAYEIFDKKLQGCIKLVLRP